MTPDIGVSLHEWKMEEDGPESPDETLEEAAELLRDVLGERGDHFGRRERRNTADPLVTKPRHSKGRYLGGDRSVEWPQAAIS